MQDHLKLGLSRRHFLVVGAAAGGGMMIGWAPTAKAQTNNISTLTPSAFIRINQQNKVTIVSPMIEMGQGTFTALPMLIAEELDIDVESVTVDHAPANDKLYGNPIIGNEQITGGSTSIRAFYLPLRKVGAAARTMLIAAAAEKWDTGAATLRTDTGYVVDASRNRRLSYGELADRAARLPIPDNVTLKDPKSFKIIGTSKKRLDVSGKVDGSSIYGMDVKLPGMKTATVAASPVFGGTLPTFHGGPHAALTTKDVVDTLAKATQAPGAVAKDKGNAVAALAASARKVEAVYEAPFLAHATMEPMNCAVSVTAGGCDIWVGTQIPTRAQKAVASALGLNVDQVRVHNHLLGGGFGRRLEFDFIVQAALIGKQLSHPVKVIWSREEDIQQDMYRPYYYDRIAAGLDNNGMPVAWTHRIAGSAIVARFFPSLFKDGVDIDGVDGAVDLPYAIANQRVEFVRVEPAAIPTSWWRGVGPTHNIYVVESFIDELAAVANKDPVEYRRALLQNNPRALHVLNRAAELSGWGKPLGERRGRGISLQQTFGTFMSQVAEVTVAKSGEIRVDRVVVVVDTGVVVNPDIVTAQMQSGIIFGISAVLWGEITFENGRVQQSNFDNYRVLRMEEAPVIEVEIVKSYENPGGIGEPGTSALAPAVLNAVHAATGVRLRKTPIGSSLPVL